MKKLVYSPEYRIKLAELRVYLEEEFGTETRRRVLRRITDRLHLLQRDEYSGVALRALYGIETEYRYVFIEHSYVFYRTDQDTIYVINIYNEREDFMYRLFGIRETAADEEE